MKTLLFFILPIGLFLTISQIAFPKKTSDKFCHQIEQNPNWTEEPFKSDYSIQFPDGYEGIGMAGFEGNTFEKYLPDWSTFFYYYFCGTLHCDDFGNPLPSPPPKELEFSSFPYIPTVNLPHREYFCQNGNLVGILYHTDTLGTNHGAYFMNVEDQLLEGLSIIFDQNDKDEVMEIIKSIKEN